jgi:hypothetical protein
MNKVLLKYLMPHLNPVEDVSDGKISTRHQFNPPAVTISVGVNLFRCAEPLLAPGWSILKKCTMSLRFYQDRHQFEASSAQT